MITAGGDILQMSQAVPGSVVNILMAVILFVVLGRKAGAALMAALATEPARRRRASPGTPLLYATLAELVSERAGIVNLGLEGVMLVGAVTGFAVTARTGIVGARRARRGGRRRATRSTCSSRTWSSGGGPTSSPAGLALMFCGVGL